MSINIIPSIEFIENTIVCSGRVTLQCIQEFLCNNWEQNVKNIIAIDGYSLEENPKNKCSDGHLYNICKKNTATKFNWMEPLYNTEIINNELTSYGHMFYIWISVLKDLPFDVEEWYRTKYVSTKNEKGELIYKTMIQMQLCVIYSVYPEWVYTSLVVITLPIQDEAIKTLKALYNRNSDKSDIFPGLKKIKTFGYEEYKELSKNGTPRLDLSLEQYDHFVYNIAKTIYKYKIQIDENPNEFHLFLAYPYLHNIYNLENSI